jgi:hypothetical protein
VLIAVFLMRSSFAFVFLEHVSDYRDLSFTVFKVKGLYDFGDIRILIELELMVYLIS